MTFNQHGKYTDLTISETVCLENLLRETNMPKSTEISNIVSTKGGKPRRSVIQTLELKSESYLNHKHYIFCKYGFQKMFPPFDNRVFWYLMRKPAMNFVLEMFP